MPAAPDVDARKVGLDAILDCIIVGAGPAGLTAGLYLQRFRRHVLVIDAGGGRAQRISRSNNVAGFPGGISGNEILERMHRHLQLVGGQVMRGTVRALHLADGGLFTVDLGNATLTARSVLLCTGVHDRRPPHAGALAAEAAGLLSYCPICDGYEQTGKRIGVLGNSAHSVREAAFLKRFSPHVYFVGIDDQSDALGPALSDAKVPVLRGRLEKLMTERAGEVILAMSDGSKHRFDVVYAALGVDPCAELATGLGARLDEIGNIVADAHGCTSVQGLYAAGDVVRSLDQIGVAIGQAAIAATAIHSRL